MTSLLRRASSGLSDSKGVGSNSRRYLLKLTPIAARDLLPKASRNSYCTLVLLDENLHEIKGEKQRTPTAKGENPIWSPLKLEMTRIQNETLGLNAAAANEEYTFGLTCDIQTQAKYVLVKCKDKGVVETEDLGRLLLSLDELDTSGTERVAWYDLQLRPGGKMVSVQGALQVASRIVREPSLWQLWKCATQMAEELDIKDRSSYLKLHSRCFTGSSAVEWLLRHGPQRVANGGITVSTEEGAILIGNCMIRARIMIHVSNDVKKPFVNNVRTLYRFVMHSNDLDEQNRSLKELGRVLEAGPDADDDETALFKNPDDSTATVSSTASLLSKVSSASSSGATTGPPVPLPLFPVRNSKAGLNINDFKLIRVLGSGTYGRVLAARGPNGRVYAIKIVSKIGLDEMNRHTTKLECDVLREIHHPFVSSLEFAFQNEDKLYMGMEFYNGGDLRHHLMLHQKQELNLSHERIVFYAAELVAGLSHLHSLDIVLRDLKPENVLIGSDGHVRIVEFNMKKIDQQGVKNEPCLEYSAPEVLEKSIVNDVCCDYWSLGVIIFEMYVGRTPFKDANKSIMLRNILDGSNLYLPEEQLPEDAASLIRGLVEKNLERRLGYKEVVPAAIMHHPYFSTIDWDALLAKEVAPPWIPDVVDSADAKYIDNEFANQIPMDTPEWRMLDSVDREREHLVDFTYQANGFNKKE